jgi:hypothetical protein
MKRHGLKPGTLFNYCWSSYRGYFTAVDFVHPATPRRYHICDPMGMTHPGTPAPCVHLVELTRHAHDPYGDVVIEWEPPITTPIADDAEPEKSTAVPKPSGYGGWDPYGDL